MSHGASRGFLAEATEGGGAGAKTGSNSRTLDLRCTEKCEKNRERLGPCRKHPNSDLKIIVSKYGSYVSKVDLGMSRS